LQGGEFAEIVSPFQTMLATRDARAVSSERELARLVGCDQVFELFLARAEAVRMRDAPMAWHLSRISSAAMKSALTDSRRANHQPVQAELERIAATALRLPRSTKP